MIPRGGFDAKTSRRRLPRTAAARDAIAGLVHADPAKALVMDFIAQLVAEGFAEWEMLGDDEIELRFNNGETFILAKKVIIRMA
jgi:hypothetical protein